jgi:hypothetical protein
MEERLINLRISFALLSKLWDNKLWDWLKLLCPDILLLSRPEG